MLEQNELEGLIRGIEEAHLTATDGVPLKTHHPDFEQWSQKYNALMWTAMAKLRDREMREDADSVIYVIDNLNRDALRWLTMQCIHELGEAGWHYPGEEPDPFDID